MKGEAVQVARGNAVSRMMNRAIGLCSTYPLRDLVSQAYEKTIGEGRRFARLWIDDRERMEVCLPAPSAKALKGHISLLYVLHRPLDNGGGTELFTRHLAGEMARQGHCVTVLAHADGRRGSRD